MKKKFTLSRAIIWIFFSATAIFSVCIRAYQYFAKPKKLEESKVPIKAIIQTGPQKEALTTGYLAELLSLSSDQPTFSVGFDPKQAQMHLLASPLIKEAEVELNEPGVLYIDYTIRQPMCFLYDFENIALDAEGVPFPFTPFFSPKKLPEVYLGLKEGDLEWNKPLVGEKVQLAFTLLKILEGPFVCDLFNVKRIDVSQAFKKSLGKREIVLLTEDECFITQREKEVRCIFPRILRLSTKNYTQELSNYLKLREQLLEKEQMHLDFPEEEVKQVVYPQKVIDFRIQQLAFIEEEK